MVAPSWSFLACTSATCRALGLGTFITTNHPCIEAEFNLLLGILTEMDTFALMPFGWPGGISAQ